MTIYGGQEEKGLTKDVLKPRATSLFRLTVLDIDGDGRNRCFYPL